MVSVLLTSLVAYQALPTEQSLDRFLEAELRRSHSPGMSVAVVRDGKVVYAKGVGFADLQNDVRATPQTVFRIGSVTKQFTATMIMQLVNEGKLKLDDPVRKTLPELPEAWSAITVRQILNHTSGIKSYTSLPDFFPKFAKNPTTPEGIWRLVEKEPLEFAPGSKWNYNNTAYELNGIIIERLDGRPYRESLQARILGPLGMRNTYFTSEDTLIKHRAQGYGQGPDGFVNAKYLNMDWPYAAGSIESTVLDLAKWDAALYGDKILPQSSLAQMWTPTRLSDGKIQEYGFGWSLSKVNGIPIVEHSGGINGFVSDIRRAPSKRLTVIVLTNSETANAPEIARRVMGFVDPSLKIEPPKAIADPTPAITKIVRGVFDSIAANQIDRSRLTESASKVFTPESLVGYSKQLQNFGRITKMELIKAEDTKEGKRRTYRITFGETVVYLEATLDATDKIAGLGLHP